MARYGGLSVPLATTIAGLLVDLPRAVPGDLPAVLGRACWCDMVPDALWLAPAV